MPLSEEQEEKMYDSALVACESLKWIRARLDKGDKKLADCDERLGILEDERIVLKGKLGAIVIIMSVCFTAALHAIGWFVQMIGK